MKQIKSPQRLKNHHNMLGYVAYVANCYCNRSAEWQYDFKKRKPCLKAEANTWRHPKTF